MAGQADSGMGGKLAASCPDDVELCKESMSQLGRSLDVIGWAGQGLLDVLDRAPMLLLLALILFLSYRRDTLDGLLARLTKAKIAGQEFEFAKTELIRADESRSEPAGAEESVPALRSTVVKKSRMSDDEVARVMVRAKEKAALLKGKRVLWIDDQPGNNVHEDAAFARLGLTIFPAPSDDAATRLLSAPGPGYDLVLSDIKRDGDSKAGTAFLRDALLPRHPDLPVIFYVTEYDPARPAPSGAFGITNRPDELLHLILDALERKG